MIRGHISSFGELIKINVCPAWQKFELLCSAAVPTFKSTFAIINILRSIATHRQGNICYTMYGHAWIWITVIRHSARMPSNETLSLAKEHLTMRNSHQTYQTSSDRLLHTLPCLMRRFIHDCTWCLIKVLLAGLETSIKHLVQAFWKFITDTGICYIPHFWLWKLYHSELVNFGTEIVPWPCESHQFDMIQIWKNDRSSVLCCKSRLS